MSGLHETTEESMIAAHKAGADFWRRNKPSASRELLESFARSCGWHGADNEAWLAGFYGAKRRAVGCPKCFLGQCTGDCN